MDASTLAPHRAPQRDAAIGAEEGSARALSAGIRWYKR
jgi:hypothetical protein